jgi:OmpA-OmpF porin, OOP family
MKRPYANLVLAASIALPFAIATAEQAGQVVVAGMVADEASKAALLARLRELYGNERVLDQLSLGNVSTPANWNAYVQKLMNESQP